MDMACSADRELHDKPPLTWANSELDNEVDNLVIARILAHCDSHGRLFLAICRQRVGDAMHCPPAPRVTTSLTIRK